MTQGGRVLRRLAVLVLALCAAIMLVGTAFAFTDMDAGHPYSAAVSDLTARGVISGYADGSFRPESSMLRGQFAKMIVGALKIDPNSGGDPPFTDLGPALTPDGYPVRYVAAAYAKGITEGRTPTHFFPYFEVSRAQAITMIVRAAQRLEVADLATPPADYRSTLGEFSRVHGPSAALAEYNGLLAGLQGFEQGWDPWVSATRGEVAQMLENLLLLSDGAGAWLHHYHHGFSETIRGPDRVRRGLSDCRKWGHRPIPQPVRPHVGCASQLVQLRRGRPDDARHAGRRRPGGRSPLEPGGRPMCGGGLGRDQRSCAMEALAPGGVRGHPRLLPRPAPEGLHRGGIDHPSSLGRQSAAHVRRRPSGSELP